jgi:hypothetical protein
MFPDWEGNATALFKCEHAARFGEFKTGLDFTRGISAVSDTGHGHISTFLTYYYAIWPLALASEMHGELSILVPSQRYLEATLGSTDAHRTAKFRAKRLGKKFATWDFLSASMSSRLKLPRLCRRQPLPIASRSDAVKQASSDRGALGATALARIAGRTLQDAAHRFGVTHSTGKILEDAVANRIHDKNSLHKRRGGVARPRGMAADLRLSESSLAEKLIATFADASDSVLQTLSEDLDPQRTNVGRLHLLPTALFARLQTVAQALPPFMFLYVRFSSKYEVPLTIEQMETLGPRVAFGSRERNIGRHPLIQIGLTESPDNRVTTGRTSVLVRSAVAAALAARAVRRAVDFKDQ